MNLSIQSLVEGNEGRCGRGGMNLASVAIEKFERVLKIVLLSNLRPRASALPMDWRQQNRFREVVKTF